MKNYDSFFALPPYGHFFRFSRGSKRVKHTKNQFLMVRLSPNFLFLSTRESTNAFPSGYSSLLVPDANRNPERGDSTERPHFNLVYLYSINGPRMIHTSKREKNKILRN